MTVEVGTRPPATPVQWVRSGVVCDDGPTLVVQLVAANRGLSVGATASFDVADESQKVPGPPGGAGGAWVDRSTVPGIAGPETPTARANGLGRVDGRPVA